MGKYYSLHYSIYLIVLRDSGENCQCWESWNKRELPGRMMRHYPQLFSNSAKVEAIATYVPRCINSMDAFLTRLMLDNPSLRIQRNEGRQYDDISPAFLI